ALLAAIRYVRPVRAEEPRRLAFGGTGIDMRGDAFHAALVILVGAVDVEEFEARPLRRACAVMLDETRDAPVEEMLRPAIGVERTQPRQGGARAIVVEAGAAIAIGRGG